jgi:hypothetical protein
MNIKRCRVLGMHPSSPRAYAFGQDGSGCVGVWAVKKWFSSALRGILLVNGDFFVQIYGIGGVTNGRVRAWQGWQ